MPKPSSRSQAPPREPAPTPDALERAAGDFGLLASPVRLHIVWALAGGELDVGSLAERVGAMLPAVSQHLAKLKLAGMVRSRRDGRRQVYLVDDPQLVALVRTMLGRVERPERPERPERVRPSGAGRARAG